MVTSLDNNHQMMNSDNDNEQQNKNKQSHNGPTTNATYFSIRIVDVDYYMCRPTSQFDITRSPLDQSIIQQLPVVRVFGSTPAGQKCCLHLHNTFPYFFIQYDDDLPLESDHINTFIRKLVACINSAMGDYGNKKAQHIFNIKLTKGRPFYGYYPDNKIFIKIFLYNPDNLNKITNILRSGTIMGRKFDVFEAHIPFMLQVFLDYNLAGMAFIDFTKVYFRNPLPSCRHSLWDGGEVDKSQFSDGQVATPNHTIIEYRKWFDETCKGPEFDKYLSTIQSRKTTCELEVDGMIGDTTNINYNSHSPVEQTEVEKKVVKSLNLIWDDEVARRRANNLPIQFTQVKTQERKPINLGYFSKPLAYQQIDEVIQIERQRESDKQKLNQNVSIEEITSQPDVNMDILQHQQQSLHQSSQIYNSIPLSNSPDSPHHPDPLLKFKNNNNQKKKNVSLNIKNNNIQPKSNNNNNNNNNNNKILNPKINSFEYDFSDDTTTIKDIPPRPIQQQNNQSIIKDESSDEEELEAQEDIKSQNEDIINASQKYREFFSPNEQSWSDGETNNSNHDSNNDSYHSPEKSPQQKSIVSQQQKVSPKQLLKTSWSGTEWSDGEESDDDSDDNSDDVSQDESDNSIISKNEINNSSEEDSQDNSNSQDNSIPQFDGGGDKKPNSRTSDNVQSYNTQGQKRQKKSIGFQQALEVKQPRRAHQTIEYERPEYVQTTTFQLANPNNRSTIITQPSPTPLKSILKKSSITTTNPKQRKKVHFNFVELNSQTIIPQTPTPPKKPSPILMSTTSTTTTTTSNHINFDLTGSNHSGIITNSNNDMISHSGTIPSSSGTTIPDTPLSQIPKSKKSVVITTKQHSNIINNNNSTSPPSPVKPIYIPPVQRNRNKPSLREMAPNSSKIEVLDVDSFQASSTTPLDFWSPNSSSSDDNLFHRKISPITHSPTKAHLVSGILKPGDSPIKPPPTNHINQIVNNPIKQTDKSLNHPKILIHQDVDNQQQSNIIDAALSPPPPIYDAVILNKKSDDSSLTQQQQIIEQKYDKQDKMNIDIKAEEEEESLSPPIPEYVPFLKMDKKVNPVEKVMIDEEMVIVDREERIKESSKIEEEEDIELMDSPINYINAYKNNDQQNSQDSDEGSEIFILHESPQSPHHPNQLNEESLSFSFSFKEPSQQPNQKEEDQQPIKSYSPLPSLQPFESQHLSNQNVQPSNDIIMFDIKRIFKLEQSPPTNQEIEKELEQSKQPVNVYKRPYYSNPKDTKRLIIDNPIKPWTSKLKQSKGLQFWANLESNEEKMKYNLPQQRVFVPAIPPPSSKELLKEMMELEKKNEAVPSFHLHGQNNNVQKVKSRGENDQFIYDRIDHSQISQTTPTFSYLKKMCQDVDNIKGGSPSLKSNLNQFLTTLSVEIHVNTRGTMQPDPDIDPVIVICYCLRDEGSIESMGDGYRDVKGVLMIAATEKNETGHDVTMGLDCPVRVYRDERSLMQGFASLCRAFDVDILIGFEIQYASVGYIIERATAIGVSLCDEISRLVNPLDGNPETTKSNNFFVRERDKFGYDHSSGIYIVGRILLNVWRILRHEITLDNYSYENLCFHALKRRVPSYSHQVLTKWYGDPKLRVAPPMRWKTLRHCLERAAGTLDLINSFDIVGRSSEFARVYGIDFFSVLSRGSQFRVESMLLRLTKPENYILYSPTREQTTNQPMPECIPLVMDPTTRMYDSPVVVLDFQSLYPSIMIAHNYCYSTCLGRTVPTDSHTNMKKLGSGMLKMQNGLLEALRNNDAINVAPNGVMFVKSDTRRGIFPRLLSEVLETRIMVKRAMKKHRSNPRVYRMLDARQLGLKLMANVAYGYTSATYSGRMSCIDIGDSIVQTARESLESAIKITESVREWNASVVYGDTDSMFVLLPGRTRAQAFEVGQQIAERVTSMLPRPVRLVLEKVYHPCLLVNKKRYVGYKYEAGSNEPVFHAKGIETVRRDSCKVVSKTMERSLRLLFEHKDLSLVKDYIIRQFRKILEDRVSLRDFIFAKEVRMENYVNAHVEGAALPAAAHLARRLMETDKRADPRYGERVRYVVVYGLPNSRLCDLVVTPHEYMSNPHLRINTIYYITKQMVPALDRIFKLVNANVPLWFTSLPKQYPSTFNQRLGQLYLQHTNQLAPNSTIGNQQYTIDQFYKVLNCFVCGSSINNQHNNNNNNSSQEMPICDQCSDIQSSYYILMNRLNNLETLKNQMYEICHTCSHDNRYYSDIECQSLDCETFFERHKLTTLYNNMLIWFKKQQEKDE